MRKSNLQEFIYRANQIHNFIYTYENTIYIDSKTKLVVTCKIHGPFEIAADNHLQGQGCKNCKYIRVALIRKENAKATFINKSFKIHGNKYDYSQVNYIGAKSDITILCPIHGPFSQTPNNHLNGAGCPICGEEYCKTVRLSTSAIFIKKAKQKHPNYSYNDSIYINAKTKITVTCLTHGPYTQLPSVHLNGQGCPHCRSSRGEEEITNILTKKNIVFVRQLRIQECKNIRPLPFDFAIYKNDQLIGLIEYNGEQHYKRKKGFWYKTEEEAQLKLNETQQRDQIKKSYCKKNNIPLLIIPYIKQKQIKNLLNTFVKHCYESNK